MRGSRHPTRAAAAPFVLVTLDTFRADHLGRIGGWTDPVETPNLDALADRGALYTSGDRPRPQTVPSHATLLTGEAPASHGVITNRSRLGHPTIASELRAADGERARSSRASCWRRHSGLDAGFDTYDDVLGVRERMPVDPPRSFLADGGATRRPHGGRRESTWLAHRHDPVVRVDPSL
jgi:hypothetical protein